MTNGPIFTRIRSTFIDVYLALITTIANRTVTRESCNLIVAGTTILAGMRQTFVYIDMAPVTCEPWFTITLEGTDRIVTNASHTGIRCTLIDV